jgi:helicase
MKIIISRDTNLTHKNIYNYLFVVYMIEKDIMNKNKKEKDFVYNNNNNNNIKYKKIPEKTLNPTIDIGLDTIQKNKQALIFVNTKSSAEKTAEDISKTIKITSIKQEEIAQKILKALSTPTKQCKRLADCVKKGIAFHHSGLNSKQRLIVEDNFKLGNIKIIACTPTLAAGLNLPAYRAIIRDLKRFTYRGMQYIPNLEYLQMAGRAGRPGYDDYGEAICIATTEEEKNFILEKFINGEPEEIYSKLAVEPVFRTYLLSLIATGFIKTKTEIIDFFQDSFWAHQFKDLNKLTFIIENILEILINWEFIRVAEQDKETGKKEKSDFVSADTIFTEEKYLPTILGKRVAELYVDPLTAHEIIKCLRLASEKKQLKTFTIIEMVTNTLEMRPLLKATKRDIMDIEENIVFYEEDFLRKIPSIYEDDYDTFINSVKTTMCLKSWVNEDGEDDILENFKVRPGELKIKIDNAIWLLYVAKEITSLQKFSHLIKSLEKVRFRLKYGVKEELFPVLKLKGIGRVLARKMFKNQIKTIKDVKEIDIHILTKLIGPTKAKSIKEQVGIDVSNMKLKKDMPVRLSTVKRKGGQSSLSHFF